MPVMARVFDFVNIAGPEDAKNAEHKRLVHSKAMRAFRRTERLERLRAHERSHLTESQSSSIDSSPQSSNNSVVVTQHDRASRPRISLARVGAYVGTDFFDPFHSLPLALPKSHQMLVRHFVWGIGSIPIPVTTSHPNELWTQMMMGRAVACPMLFHAVCCHAAEHLNMLHGGRPTPISLQLRGLTLRTVNKVMHDGPRSLEPDTIAALLLLVANALISGDAEELVLHRRAVDTVVSMRGGLAETGYEGALRSISRWHFAPYIILTRLQTAGRESLESGPSDPDVIGTVLCHDTLEGLLRQCRALSEVQISRSGNTSGMMSRAEFDDQRTTLEYDFAQLWLQLEATQLDSALAAGALKCGCLAGLLFTFYHLSVFIGHSRVTKSLIAAIIRMAEQMRAVTIGKTSSIRYRELLLWSLAVVMMVSTDVHERQQLVAVMQSIIDSLDLAGCDLWLAHVHDIAWVPGVWDDVLRRNFEEMSYDPQ